MPVVFRLPRPLLSDFALEVVFLANLGHMMGLKKVIHNWFVNHFFYCNGVNDIFLCFFVNRQLPQMTFTV